MAFEVVAASLFTALLLIAFAMGHAFGFSGGSDDMKARVGRLMSHETWELSEDDNKLLADLEAIKVTMLGITGKS